MHPLRNPLTVPWLLLALSPAALSQSGGEFGGAVSSADVNGDGFGDVIVGEPLFDGRGTDCGRVLVYHGSAAGLATSPAWVRGGGQPGAHFGAALAGVGDLDGDGFGDVAIGAPDADAPPVRRASGPGAHAGLARDAGAVAVFLGSPAGLASSPVLVHFGVESREHLGIAVAGAGDVNGDGFDEVIAGAPGSAAGLGAALVFHGSPAGPGSLPSAVILGNQPGARFGFAVAGGGDVNGDGFDDVIVGAPSEAVQYLYGGSPTGLPASPSWTFTEAWLFTYPDQGGLGTLLGHSVAFVGDADGDGYDDFLASNPGHDAFFLFDVAYDAGLTGVPVGSPDGPTWRNFAFIWGDTRPGPWSAGLLGFSTASAGDVNGDGLGDAIVGAPSLAQRIDIGYGNTDMVMGWATTIRGSQTGAAFGRAVSSAGDVDGDGFDDVVVGEPGWDGATADQGRVHVYRGSPGGVANDAPPTWSLVAP